MPFVHFWHRYTHQHAGHGGSVTVDPQAVFVIALCLTLLLAWWVWQLSGRCRTCGAVPVRCRCRR